MIPSSVLHCASLLRTIFASSEGTIERVHLHNNKKIPQGKLNSEINARFLLNGHGHVAYILLHNNSVHFTLLYLKKNTLKFHMKKKI